MATINCSVFELEIILNLIASYLKLIETKKQKTFKCAVARVKVASLKEITNKSVG